MSQTLQTMFHLSTLVRVFPKSRFGARNFSQSLDITKSKLKFNITPQEIRDNTKKLIENGNKVKAITRLI